MALRPVSMLAAPINLMNLRDPLQRRVLARYFGVIVPAHVAWEFAQMPLYTLWETGSCGEIVFAALHCSVGDWMIAAASLLLAVILVGGREWPRQRFDTVALLAIAFGIAYTLFSEWLNTEVRLSWAYAEAMPRLPWLGIGLTPLLQWMILPALGFWWARAAVHAPIKAETRHARS
jgi:hypothetical protein